MHHTPYAAHSLLLMPHAKRPPLGFTYEHPESPTLAPTLRRPYLATLCDDVTEAERWRNQILKEIGKKVSQIQNSM